MQSWKEPKLPRSTVLAPVPRIHDTASHSMLALPGTDARARMYVCGITPYDATHMGHAATYVAFDLLNRAWRNAGIAVDFVQNVTDVDDPLLERAQATGVDWTSLAESEIALFREDMEALEVIPPRDYIGAVESIPLVIEMIQELQDAGMVYRVDRDLYFRSHSVASFGAVSGFEDEQMRSLFAERGGDPERPGKEDALDCLLWQAERPGEPAWESPFGSGRPGWHVECSAIARHYLGTAFEVQGGGSDLVFPHHEMSAAQANALSPTSPFALCFAHAGMVGLDGEKMSKSKGNLVLVSQLRAQGVDPRVIRLALLNHHYRSDWEWLDSDASQAHERLRSWQAAINATSTADAGPVVVEVQRALAEDLDAPRALRAVDQWALSTIQGGHSQSGQEQIRDLVASSLGLTL
ncbi:MAG TPA: cysteine--1-D-myo-inosityl 2-amino-2-deoxy-alpha-D-glucopyranoside ligase [Marmoricola sp.]|jgi:L-cysteine:1D-myo-inositol 2-amino-2-deoxy-alpha-D-glucopyranoside ligase|nr:cysteine--1-D-myo-inosityl 2-amino-2-deoxy-alpha-D-glucopyranoside ligase [Nocardioidaceae bacterium]MCB8992553.1 cysteine--1-D-myo-inosityl 2-amino-2-deoxy-alpha-D-glucopyranoside ligase [Nocardioidaceae bacterium]MCO5323644.1 cysteine--1-D-myo-inosityl 2-amino-2-deoxy-alpha-D-glucopyranoside ligase [Nocardioidaceae bacterium]HRV68384.1 cysteine--1-D-myo-inosityl 2-amino-2-deoxy-alpha-D-glucopyranoside ligase [Marmoricola sp.]